MKQCRRDYLTCRICKKPLRLGADTSTDESGKSVHEDCQVKRIIGTQRYEELTRPTHHINPTRIALSITSDQ